ncbi:hypothetical protein [Paenibacillus sp. 1001270B_150601_E10]|nr:hypothetical protein [Paenibacillus sp. 1001270B_150601_E10]
MAKGKPPFTIQVHEGTQDARKLLHELAKTMIKRAVHESKGNRRKGK